MGLVCWVCCVHNSAQLSIQAFIIILSEHQCTAGIARVHRGLLLLSRKATRHECSARCSSMCPLMQQTTRNSMELQLAMAAVFSMAACQDIQFFLFLYRLVRSCWQCYEPAVLHGNLSCTWIAQLKAAGGIPQILSVSNTMFHDCKYPIIFPLKF